MLCNGVDVAETIKNIENLLEKERKNGDIKKYVKYLCSINVESKINLVVMTKQLTEFEIVLIESIRKKQ